MAEYIDRDLTVQKIVNIGNENYEGKYPNIGMVHAAQIVKSMPSADVAPVIHAKWIERETEKGTKQYICSNCYDYHEFRSDRTNLHSVRGNFLYCRKCGAKMDL